LTDVKWFVARFWDDAMRLWIAAIGEFLCMCAGHSSAVWALAFSADGALPDAGSSDKSMRLWSPEMIAFVRASEVYSDVVDAVAFARSGNVLASGSEDKAMRL